MTYELVISGGDSFTFGAELSMTIKDSFNPHPNSWANLVAQRIGKQHINVARSGRSNSYIVRHVMHEIQCAMQSGIDPNRIFVQVMWTFADRHEFAISMPTGEYDSPWMFFTPYTHIDETQSEWFKSVSKSLSSWQGVQDNLKKVYNKNKSLGIVDFYQQYQKLIQTSTLNDSYTSFKEVLLLQNTLKLYNIPYLFTYVNQHVMHGLFEDSSSGPGSKYLNSMRLLNHDENWYTFPGKFQKYVGFDDWAKHNEYEYATSHPLKEAHEAAAELIYKHLESKDYLHEE